MASFESDEIALDEALALRRDEYMLMSQSVQWKAIYTLFQNALPGHTERVHDMIALLVNDYEGNQDIEDPGNPTEQWIEHIAMDVLIEEGGIVTTDRGGLIVCNATLISRFQKMTLDLHQIESVIPIFLADIDGSLHRFSINPITKIVASPAPVDFQDLLELGCSDIAKGMRLPIYAALQQEVSSIVKDWSRASEEALQIGSKSPVLRGGQVVVRDGSDDVYAITVALGADANDVGSFSMGMEAMLLFECQVRVSGNDQFKPPPGQDTITWSIEHKVKIGFNHDSNCTCITSNDSLSGSLVHPSDTEESLFDQAHLVKAITTTIRDRLDELEHEVFSRIQDHDLPSFRVFQPIGGMAALFSGVGNARSVLSIHDRIWLEQQSQLRARFEKM